MTLTEKIKGKLASILSPHFLGREQEALVELAGATLDEAQVMIDEGDAGLQEQLNTLKSEYGAGLIGIEDVADNFVSFNVEGALLELAERDILSDDSTVTGKWDFAQDIGFVRNGFTAELSVPSLSDDRTYTLKNASGTLAFLSDIPPQLNLVAGSNININGSYPNLTISAAGSGPGEGVASVNGQIGDVVLTASDVGAAPATHTHTIAQVSGLQTALNGKAASSHTHSAADITSGTIARARLGSGTANSDSFLRGDGVWAVPDTGTGGGGGTVTRVQVAGGTGLSFTGGPITTTGTITGTLSTNLQSWSGISPSSKANTSHTHTISNITGLQAALNEKLGPSTAIGSSENLNNITTTGYYHQNSSANATTALNYPTNVAGMLEVVDTGNMTYQFYTTHSSRTVYVRQRYQSTWYAWTQLWDSTSFDPSTKANTSHTHAAGDITSGTLNSARIPNLPASKITSGEFSEARIPTLAIAKVSGLQTALDGKAASSHNHSATNITSGTLNADRIPNLNASKITAGTLGTARIPDLSSSYVNTSTNQTGIAGNKTFTGTITASNLTATSDTRLKYDIVRKEPRQELLEFIKLYGWKWIHNKEEGLGVLAQDVKKIAPEYVHEAEDGMLSVDKAGLAIEMVMAMMEKIDGSSN